MDKLEPQNNKKKALVQFLISVLLLVLVLFSNKINGIINFNVCRSYSFFCFSGFILGSIMLLFSIPKLVNNIKIPSSILLVISVLSGSVSYFFFRKMLKCDPNNWFCAPGEILFVTIFAGLALLFCAIYIINKIKKKK